MEKVKICTLLSLIIMSFGLSAYAGNTQSNRFDIVVYGETPSGVLAAVQAARMGKKVALLSTTKHIGGVMTSGLTATDMNRYKAIGGLAREVFQRIYAHYLQPDSWDNQVRDAFFEMSKKRTYTGKNDSLSMQWVYESHVLEKIFNDLLEESGVSVHLNKRLNREQGLVKENNHIVSIETLDGNTYHAHMFIDATYEGDLMAAAGVSYTVGREANSQYGETRNGYNLYGKPFHFDPYREKGNPESGLLPYIELPNGRVEGSADDKVQAYTYRVTLTNDPTNRVAIVKPKNYNPLWYEAIARRLLAGEFSELQKVITITPMPNRKTDTNHLDFVGAGYDWAEASYEERKEIAQMHQDYALGKLWFLANDERVPEDIQEEMRQWGLAKDEFKDNKNFPHQLYVREARRMISDFVMTEENCRRKDRIDASEAVGLGTYAFDSHDVAAVYDGTAVWRDGAFFGAASVYPISYRSIIPKSQEATNLVVPVCLSASHVGYSTIRMEPVFMVLGQSAGTAAALAIDQNTTLQKLPYSELANRLLADGQILDDKKVTR